MNYPYQPMGCNVGCPTPGYAGYAGYGGGYGNYAMQPYVNYDIIGADPVPANETFTDKLKRIGNQETLGIQNKYLAGGAVAIGAIALAASAGWFGATRGRRR